MGRPENRIRTPTPRPTLFMTLSPTVSEIIPTAAEFEEGLRLWVSRGCGLDSKYVQPGNTGQPAPNVPYATVLLVQPNLRGRPRGRKSEESTTQARVTVSARVIDRYSVQFFREGAQDRARQFSLWAYSQEGRQFSQLAEHPFTFIRVVAINQVSGIIASDYEQRYGVTIDVGYYQTVRETFNRWAAAELEITDGVITETVTAGS